MAQASKSTVLLSFLLLLLLSLSIFLYMNCHDSEPARELCDNGADDDDDGLVDCLDIDCLGVLECRGGDSHKREVRRQPSAPTQPIATAGDRVESRDDDVTPAIAEVESAGCVEGEDCGSDCQSDDECVLVLDGMNCCGGAVHRAGEEGEELRCPSAVTQSRLDEDDCVVLWNVGSETSPPEDCRPHCFGVRCSVCTPPHRARCHRGRCVGVMRGGCLSDEECPEGYACIDPDFDGMRTCVVGEHECETDEQCRERHPTCAGCNCLDGNEDQLRDCLCWDCEGQGCSRDDDCGVHHFCEDHRCVDFGPGSCHVGGVEGECEDDETCEPLDPEDGNSRRGRCNALEAEDK